MVSVILDSSNSYLSVAIANDDTIIDQISYEAWQRQSELMIPELDKLLKRNNVTRHDINKVIVSIGPGSYTGVRIALSIAKVMVLALNVPLYAISSLHAMKDNDNPSICIINARSARSYVGVYKGSEVVVQDQIMTNEQLLNYIEEHKDYKLIGDISYLGLEGENKDILNGLFELSKVLSPVKDTLGLTPVYLKD